MLMKCLLTFTLGGIAVMGEVTPADLKHFTQVDEHIFAGSKPKKAADFEFLRQKGVKYILQADFLPGMSGKERKEAAKFGIQYMSVHIGASPAEPSEKDVNEALRIMHTDQPIYLHCVLGRDRTSMLAGLYRIYFDGMTKEEAYRLMKAEGFRDVWFLHGLKAYFDKHADKRYFADLKP
jgi:hypothetical protein